MIFLDETEYGHGDEYNKLPRIKKIINFFLDNIHFYLDDGITTIVTDIFIETFDDDTVEPYFHSSLLLKAERNDDKTILKFISTYSNDGYMEGLTLNHSNICKEIVEESNIKILEEAYIISRKKFKLEGEKFLKK